MARVLPFRRSGSRSSLTAVPLLTLAAVSLAGCSAVSPITSKQPYNASDGVRAELGSDLVAQNLLVISAAQGEPGALIGGMTNKGSEDASVTLAADGASDAMIEVPAGTTVLFGSDNDAALELDQVSVAPGGVLPVTISTPSGGIEKLSIPVLDGSIPPYEDLIPAPAPVSTPSPTATAS